MTPSPRIPSVDALLRDAALAPLLADYGRGGATAALRQVLDALRAQLRSGTLSAAHTAPAAIAAQVQQALAAPPRAAPETRVQPHRHRAAHQPGPRPAAAGGGGARVPGAMTSPMNLEYDLDRRRARRPRSTW